MAQTDKLSNSNSHYIYNSGWQRIEKDSAKIEKMYNDLNSKILKVNNEIGSLNNKLKDIKCKPENDDNSNKMETMEDSINLMKKDINNINYRIDDLYSKLKAISDLSENINEKLEMFISNFQNESEKSKGIFSSILRKR